MKALRTPDDRFVDLPDYDFTPNYLQVDDTEGGQLRVHYLDEGPRDGPVVLLMHGEPSWCFLYRKMIPVLVQAGLRCIAPDLIGFGRSDKPTERSDYTYARHVAWMQSAFDQLDLNDVTFVGQDWGGLIGLRLVAAIPDRFKAVVTANTFLPTGDQPASPAFMKWRQFSQDVDVFPTGGILKGATVTDLTPEVIAAYDAPFPDESYKAGARQFPVLVPITPDDPEAEANRAAWQVLKGWTKPFLTAFSDSDPIMAGVEKIFQKLVPGSQGQPHVILKGGGHFLQEDVGEDLAKVVAAFMAQPN